MDIKPPDFAGSWYPATADGCREDIDRFLSTSITVDIPSSNRFGGIVPHAGWYFSGGIACRVLNALATPSPPDVVVVFGMHMSPGSTPVLLSSGAWGTPFGPLPVSRDLALLVEETVDVLRRSPATMSPDNTIELQLPFIRYLFGEVSILPVGVPPDDIALDIGQTLGRAAARDRLSMTVVGSTDLTHYGPNYGFTDKGRGKAAVEWVKEENDRRFIDALLALDGKTAIREALRGKNACCAGAAAATVAAVTEMGADRAAMTEYRTSHDKSPGDSFVGYSGIVFYRG